MRRIWCHFSEILAVVPQHCNGRPAPATGRVWAAHAQTKKSLIVYILFPFHAIWLHLYFRRDSSRAYSSRTYFKCLILISRIISPTLSYIHMDVYIENQALTHTKVPKNCIFGKHSIITYLLYKEQKISCMN